MTRSQGFTLIELLVVIAIIGILAAITFPVFAQAKKSAYRSADMSSMNSIRSALLLYRADQGGMPPALLGYATAYQNNAYSTNPSDITLANIVPANQLQAALYPKRVDSIETFRPNYDRPTSNPYEKQITDAVWPQGILYDGNNRSLQRFGPERTVQRALNEDGSGCKPVSSLFYQVSGYDVANVKVPGGGTRYEIHYAPFWSAWTVPADPCTPSEAPGSASDNPRQLGYSDPPETTVITWNSFFRDYDSTGNPLHQKQDIVLFLGGSARPYDSANVASQAWAVTP